MAHTRYDSGTRDLDQEVAHSIRRWQNEHGDPLEGLFTLTRKMETEEEDQFEVDLTILDFLTFKATEAVFEWRSSSNYHLSDLPSALVTMTSGKSAICQSVRIHLGDKRSYGSLQCQSSRMNHVY
jgi:hypothetical protein